MNIAIRVDASSQIGTGHFMRCLTLATALQQRGAKIRFVSRHMPLHLQDMLVAKGIEFSPLASAPGAAVADDLLHSHWLGTNQAQDAIDTTHALSDRTWDWLVVDHYALDARWETALRNTATRIMVIDDLADRQHDCDVLLDQNSYADMESRYIGKISPDCQLLLGPRYALLRDEFRQLHEQVKPRTGQVKRVLVFFGGVDADNYTALAIEALAHIGRPDLQVDIVIGAQHPARMEIEAACIRNRFTCHVQTNRMAELMAAADLAIGAGGSASWERCCMGLPALLVSLADNQIDIAKALDLFGACVYVGSQETASALIMRSAIIDLLSRQSDVAVLSEKSYSLVDGQGVHRLCQTLGG